MNTFETIANQVAATVQCDKSGSCIVFASELCKAAPNEAYRVVEGSVKFEGSLAFPHVWIEAGADRIDPTIEQFNFFRIETASYLPARDYTPKQFVKQVKSHPQVADFHLLKKT